MICQSKKTKTKVGSLNSFRRYDAIFVMFGFTSKNCNCATVIEFISDPTKNNKNENIQVDLHS